MADNENLHSLYIDQLRDLYSAERQILDALPKMIKRSTHRELTAALEDHRTVTERQVDRLEEEEAADHALTGIADSVVNADALRASGGT